jgi:(p)ppGpp synthase/HD superfamily hydrolase
LIASAFHYASCVAAREAGGAWEYRQHESVSTFGEHAVEISRDAARLKKLEMVFSGIVQAESPTLDSNDADNLRNLLLTESRDWRALAIRSAACLYRLRGIGFPDKLTSEAVRASREALKIFAPLASRLGMHRLKNELEEAAFRTLYRRQYETVKSLSQQMRYKKLSQFNRRDTGTLNIGESLKCVLESVKHDMEQVLNNDPVFSHSVESFTVAARVKEPYSLWKKMLRYGSDSVLQVPDALALRIVLNAKKATPEEPDEVTSARDRALCYYAQQLCTQHWAPLEKNPRFKDYIEHPKPNGYQSLHYTANTEWEGEDWTMEIQIRSGEMNQVAEYGLASHWDYKAKNKNSDYSSDSYLRSVQEWHWQQRQASLVQLDLPPEPVLWDHQEQERAERIRARTQRLEPYIKALNEAQLDLARDHVFVFMTNASSGNSIIALPSGACVLDALREHERQSGVSLDHRGRVPTVNGLSSNLTQQLRNGDILTVSMPVVSVTV